MTITVEVNFLLRSPLFSLGLFYYILAGGNSFSLHKSSGKADISLFLVFRVWQCVRKKMLRGHGQVVEEESSCILLVKRGPRIWPRII